MSEQQEGDWTDYIAGQSACRKGSPCPEGSTKWFERGYSSEYQLQEINGVSNGKPNIKAGQNTVHA